MNAQIITKKKNTLKRDLLSWIIGIPSIILFVFFIWGPLFQNIIYSFFKTSNFDMVSFNGFGNYIAIIKDPRFIGALRNTVLYVIYSLIIGFAVPVILALVISEVVKGKSIFKVGFYIPNIVPAIAVILMWKIMMDANDYGFFNVILAKLGLGTSQWISDEKLSIPLIILTLTWKSAGSTMLIYLATISRLTTRFMKPRGSAPVALAASALYNDSRPASEFETPFNNPDYFRFSDFLRTDGVHGVDERFRKHPRFVDLQIGVFNPEYRAGGRAGRYQHADPTNVNLSLFAS